jgi:hypothetical protein
VNARSRLRWCFTRNPTRCGWRLRVKPWWAIVLLIASAAHAAPHELKFRNPGTVAYTHLRTPWGTVPTSCAPGATCTVIVDVAPGYQTLTAEAAAGALWSLTSNALRAFIRPTPTECAAIPGCPPDLDRNGATALPDFTEFLRWYGKAWTKP